MRDQSIASIVKSIFGFRNSVHQHSGQLGGSVIYGPVGSAGTVLFERNTKRFAEPGTRFDGSVVGGSFGRNDQNADFTAGTPDAYARITANHAHQQDYKDGNGNTIPSQWDKWNVDTALGQKLKGFQLSRSLMRESIADAKRKTL